MNHEAETQGVLEQVGKRMKITQLKAWSAKHMAEPSRTLLALII